MNRNEIKTKRGTRNKEMISGKILANFGLLMFSNLIKKKVFTKDSLQEEDSEIS